MLSPLVLKSMYLICTDVLGQRLVRNMKNPAKSTSRNLNASGDLCSEYLTQIFVVLAFLVFCVVWIRVRQGYRTSIFDAKKSVMRWDQFDAFFDFLLKFQDKNSKFHSFRKPYRFLMPKPRPFQWYYSLTELIWPDGPSNRKRPLNKCADTHNKFKFAQSALQIIMRFLNIF